MDVGAVEHAVRTAAESVRAGAGPHFLELRTFRFRAHSMYDPDRYREKSEIAQWQERDPIPLLTERLRASGLLTDDDVTQLEADVAAEVADAVAFAQAGTDEPVEQLTRWVHSDRGGAS
jgi:pyruvate dehydrogenase E1 component alpha subunit